MEINKLQIHQAVATQREVIGDAVERALKSAAKHHRKASVNVTFTAKHDKDSPHILTLSSVLKVKEPKGLRVDITGSSESEELLRINVTEDPNQLTIGE